MEMDDFRQDILNRIKELQSQRSSDHEVSRRIGTIEQEQASILTSLKNLSSAVSELTDKISKIQDSAKTNWATLATWAGVIIVIVGMVGAGFIAQPLSDVKEFVKEMAYTQRSHVMSDGHGVALLRSKHLNEDFGRLDTTLQREMRLLKGETDTHMEGIRDRIDSETDILERQMLENRSGVSEIRERIAKLEAQTENR